MMPAGRMVHPEVFCNTVSMIAVNTKQARRRLVAGLSASLATLLPSSALAQQSSSDFSLTASAGTDYSSGDYGSESNTSVVLVPLIVRAKTGDVSLSGSLTYIRISGPGDVVIGPDGEPLPGVPNDSGVRKGLSDLSFGLGYTFGSDAAGAPQFGLSGRVKVPTSRKSAQLGTGKFDYSIRGEVSVPAGRLTPFASIGYRFLGDPDGIDLKNGITASIGASTTIGRQVLIASADYSSSSNDSTPSSRSLFAGYSRPLNDTLNITAYSVLGLSESSPDYGIGLLLSARIL